MGFKADASFLRFLTMGALGTRQVMRQLAGAGFEPIELERYCTSNKVWTTKIKRLRLPDLFCVRTGLRVEVRAKSALRIRMSDAQNNPDRAWDAGLRDDDLVAFIACFDSGAQPTPADGAAFFPVRSLRASVRGSRLGPPKSASEGSERDREWPAIIPSRDGVVEQVPGRSLERAQKLVVLLDSPGKPIRRHTYALKGKSSYVQAGDRFWGGASMIAGLPPYIARLEDYRARVFDPLTGLESTSEVDRYAAAKAIPHLSDLDRPGAVRRLETMIREERDGRVALEAAGAAVALGSTAGEAYIRELLASRSPQALCMEALLILAELHTPFALQELKRVAADLTLADSELRQAAVWGLGKTGHRSYADLVQYLDDDNENVALHAIAAFGDDAPPEVISELVLRLNRHEPRLASVASEVLRLIGGEDVLQAIVEKAKRSAEGRDWALATLGRLEGHLVRRCLAGDPLLESIEPLLCLFGEDNWLATGGRPSSLTFLLGQHL